MQLQAHFLIQPATACFFKSQYKKRSCKLWQSFSVLDKLFPYRAINVGITELKSVKAIGGDQIMSTNETLVNYINDNTLTKYRHYFDKLMMQNAKSRQAMQALNKRHMTYATWSTYSAVFPFPHNAAVQTQTDVETCWLLHLAEINQHY